MNPAFFRPRAIFPIERADLPNPWRRITASGMETSFDIDQALFIASLASIAKVWTETSGKKALKAMFFIDLRRGIEL